MILLWVRLAIIGAAFSAILGLGWYVHVTKGEIDALQADKEAARVISEQQELNNVRRIREATERAQQALVDLDHERVLRSDLEQRLRTIADSPTRQIAASAPTGAPIADAGQGQCLQDLDRLGRAAARVAVSLSDALAVSAERDAYTRQLTEGWPQ